ncbi:hypothetical protein BH10PSE10_BH10PSE10_10960 [soil metagenome]
MRKLLLTTAAATFAASALMALGAAPASAGPFCATYADGGTRSCNYYSYAACARATSGAGGQCAANTRYGGGYGGYEDSYAYAPGPAYGYEYGGGPRYYGRPGVGIYIGGY